MSSEIMCLTYSLNLTFGTSFIFISWILGKLLFFLDTCDTSQLNYQETWQLTEKHQALFGKLSGACGLVSAGRPPCGAGSQQRPAATACAPACACTVSSPPSELRAGWCTLAASRHRSSLSGFQSLSGVPLKDHWCCIFHSVLQWKYLCAGPGKKGKISILLSNITEEGIC